MKILRVVFLCLVSLFLIAFLYLLNSSLVVQKIFEYTSKELPIKYSDVQGSLYSGIYIENLNYEDNLKIEKVYLRPEILSLFILEIYIEDLKIDGITIDNKLFETKKEDNKDSINLPFNLFIKNFESSVLNYSYKDYKIEKLLLKSQNISSDLKSFLSGDFYLETKSNLANLTAFVNLNKNTYTIKSNIDFNKDFIDKNIIETSFLDKFNIEAKGDLNKINFQINTNNLNLKIKKELKLKELQTTGTYDFLTLNLDISSFNTILNYDFIDSNINSNLSIQNNDINTLIFDSSLNTSIKKDIFKKLQKDLNIKSKISGNLKEIKFINNLELNSGVIDLNGNAKIDKNNINILADLNANTTIVKQKSKIDIKLNSSKWEDFLVKVKTTINDISYENIKSNSIGIINIDTTYKKDLLNLDIKSKVANISVNSKDLKKYIFDLDIKDINPNDFYKLNENIKITSLKGKLSGIYENTLTLKGDLTLNNSIYINTNLNSHDNQIQAELSSKLFSTTISSKDEKITVKSQIKELKDFESELHKIVNFASLNLAGMIDLKAEIENSNISFEVASPKISFEEESIQKIDIKGTFKENVLTFNLLNFYISNIYNINLNKNFTLKNPAFLNTEKLNGDFDFENIKFFISKEKENFNIKVNTKDLLISHDDYANGYLTSNILISINEENKTLISGDITANKLNINYKIPSMSINKDKDIIIVYKNKNKKEKDAFFENIALQLSINANDFNYKIKNIELNGSSTLVLKKNFYENMKIFGSVQNIKGTFSELGKTYTIKDTNITFTGLEPINPILDIHATYTINDITITIIISGNLNDPRINLSSNPVMSQKDILSYLIFGTSFSNNTQTNSNSKQSQASLFLLNELSKDYAKEIGIDILYFQYDPTTQYIETFVGKNISEKNKVILKNKSTGGEIILLRELTKLWNVELGFEEKTQSLDLTYRKRY